MVMTVEVENKIVRASVVHAKGGKGKRRK